MSVRAMVCWDRVALLQLLVWFSVIVSRRIDDCGPVELSPAGVLLVADILKVLLSVSA